MRAPVGVVGLGLMGTALAARLIEAGLPVIGFDIDGARCDALQAMGGNFASCIGQMSLRCPALVFAVHDAQQVETLLDELEQHAARRTALIICTITCAPDEIRAIAARANRAGMAFVEAPISGSSVELRKGTATALVAGDVKACSAADALLEILCPQRLHVGGIGDASRTKLAINLILQCTRAALAEGIIFAESLGLDPTAFLDAARQSAAYSRVMDTKAAKMAARDFTPQSHIAQTLKDAELILREAKRDNLRLPMTSVQTALLRAAIALEGPEADSTAVIAAIRHAQSKPPVDVR
jgi:L-threonate 2-dehydrogenase